MASPVPLDPSISVRCCRRSLVASWAALPLMLMVKTDTAGSPVAFIPMSLPGLMVLVVHERVPPAAPMSCCARRMRPTTFWCASTCAVTVMTICAGWQPAMMVWGGGGF